MVPIKRLSKEEALQARELFFQVFCGAPCGMAVGRSGAREFQQENREFSRCTLNATHQSLQAIAIQSPRCTPGANSRFLRKSQVFTVGQV